jgi:hypothetical protein
MLGDVYYFFGLILFLANIGMLMKFPKIQKIKNWVDAFFNVTKRKPNSDEINKEDLRQLNSFNSILGVNFLWIFFGIITNSWKFFLLILVLNLLLNMVLINIVKYKKMSFAISLLKFFIITTSTGLLVINHFHLHIDLYTKLISLLSHR